MASCACTRLRSLLQEVRPMRKTCHPFHGTMGSGQHVELALGSNLFVTLPELVNLRVRLGLSQAEFSSLIGYLPMFYRGLEAGNLPITPVIERRVRRIAAQILENRGQRPHEDL